jgi:hypothetical protein
LAFDPIESLKTGILDVLAHSDYYVPLPGTGYKELRGDHAHTGQQLRYEIRAFACFHS